MLYLSTVIYITTQAGAAYNHIMLLPDIFFKKSKIIRQHQILGTVNLWNNRGVNSGFNLVESGKQIWKFFCKRSIAGERNIAMRRMRKVFLVIIFFRFNIAHQFLKQASKNVSLINECF